MNGLINWLPWIAIALIPGLLNALVASEELIERCRIFPFFQPYKTPGVWLWVLIQLSFPAGLFWSIASFSTKPTLTPILVAEALGFGVGFTALLNATISIGARSYSIKPIYDRFVQIAYNLIRDSKQGDRALKFWGELEDSLLQCSDIDLLEGLGYLEDYFAVEASFSLKPDTEIEEILTKIRTEPTRDVRAKLIKSLIQQVRRGKLFTILQQFPCNEELLRKNFSKKFVKVLVK